MKRSRRMNRELTSALKLLAPGTELREGLENVLRAKTGALIVIGETDEVRSIMNGGFFINTNFTPNHLYELAKMDGAVILSQDGKKILYANVELNPASDIDTKETGIRHRTAERTAKQTGLLVLSISQRRDLVTLYKGEMKYTFQDENKILAKANQALQTLEKYRRSLDFTLGGLDMLEVEDRVTVGDVCLAIKRAEMVLRVADEIDAYITELGKDGRLVAMQLDELIASVVKEYKSVILDYENFEEGKDVSTFIKEITLMKNDDLLDLTNISGLLGYRKEIELLDAPLFTRGYRQLAHIPRLPNTVIKNIVIHYDDFQQVLKAQTFDLEEVEGVGEVRARSIFDGLRRMKDNFGSSFIGI